MRECYEGYVLYNFLRLMIFYCGGDAGLLEWQAPNITTANPFSLLSQAENPSREALCPPLLLHLPAARPGAPPTPPPTQPTPTAHARATFFTSVPSAAPS